MPYRFINGNACWVGPGRAMGNLWDSLGDVAGYGNAWDDWCGFWRNFYPYFKKFGRPLLTAVANFIPAVGPALSMGLMLWSAAEKMKNALDKGEYNKAADQVVSAEEEYASQHSGLGALGGPTRASVPGAGLEKEMQALATYNELARSKMRARGIPFEDVGLKDKPTSAKMNLGPDGKTAKKAYPKGDLRFPGTYRELVHAKFIAAKSLVLKNNNGFAYDDLKWEYQKFNPTISERNYQKYMATLYLTNKHTGEYRKHQFNANPSRPEAEKILKSAGKKATDHEVTAYIDQKRSLMKTIYKDPEFKEELNHVLGMFRHADKDDQVVHGDEAPWSVNDEAFAEMERVIRKFFALADMGWLRIPRYVRLSFKEVQDTYFNWTKYGTQKIIANRINTALEPSDALVAAAQAAQTEQAVKSMRQVFEVGLRFAMKRKTVSVVAKK